MKKFTVVLVIIALLLSLASCSNNANKKIIPDTPLPKVEDNAEKPQTVDNSKDPKVSDNNEPQASENTNVDEKKDSANSDSYINHLSELPSELNTKKIIYWNPSSNKEHKVPVMDSKFKSLLDKYSGYYVGDTTSKIVYLTFDEGYENGYTSKILDILKANNVSAAFFVTKPFIKSNPDLVKRMVAEGHIVGNHSDTHPSMPDALSKKGIDGVKKELTNTAEYFKEITATDMPKFFRPPMGEWSEATLYITKELGYKTILWSMHYKDYDVNNQPGRDAAFNFVDTHYHNGAIVLLHAVSKSNTEALDDVIKSMHNKGYRFASLTELK